MNLSTVRRNQGKSKPSPFILFTYYDFASDGIFICISKHTVHTNIRYVLVIQCIPPVQSGLNSKYSRLQKPTRICNCSACVYFLLQRNGISFRVGSL